MAPFACKSFGKANDLESRVIASSLPGSNVQFEAEIRRSTPIAANNSNLNSTTDPEVYANAMRAGQNRKKDVCRGKEV